MTQSPLGLPTKENINERKKLLVDVFTKFQQKEVLEDGYAFSYPKTEAWITKLEKFTLACKTAFPAFKAVINQRMLSNSVWLSLRGPQGSKEFIEWVLNRLAKGGFQSSSITQKLNKGFRRLTSPFRVMPDFFIIGGMRCGTTALYSYLLQHPSIAPAAKKEISFFDMHFKKGEFWYRSQFSTLLAKQYAKRIQKRDFITGDATPTYIFNPHVPKRIFQKIPQAKLIVLLRNPVNRAYSLYQLQMLYKVETLSFEEAIEKEAERLDSEWDRILEDENYVSTLPQYYGYISTGIYVDQLKNWMDVFPKEQFLILTTDRFGQDAQEIFSRVTTFLDMPYWELRTYKRHYTWPYPPMKPATRKRLMAYFKPHNQRLYELLGRDLGWDE
jgi:hypothetical protein